MDEKTPLENLKNILSQVDNEASAANPAPAPSSSPKNKKDDQFFIERSKIKSFSDALQSFPGETISCWDVAALFADVDHAAMTVNIDTNQYPAFQALAETIKRYPRH